MKWQSRLVLLLAIFVLAFSTAACEKKKGNAEKAGEALDKAFGIAKEKIHNATK